MQVAALASNSHKAGAAALEKESIQTIVEFFPIDICESRQGAKYELFSIKDYDLNNHPYQEGLKAELNSSFGVYIFFDSRGRALYAGKAGKQTLWNEMNSAFNRQRGMVQAIMRVNHPTRKQQYKTNKKISRQIVKEQVPLYELATYFSAYRVSRGMIDVVEALLVRSFANDLLNIKMENLNKRKTKKKTK